MRSLVVNLRPCAPVTHEIHIGRDLLDHLATEAAARRWAGRYFIVSDTNVAPLHLARVEGHLRAAGLAVEAVVLPAGEEHKTIGTAVALAADLLELGADRTSGLIALGGGVVGDLAGFVASIYMRGIPCLQVPTSLLAQVDSSIGGKTGVDVPAAKNMIGTFHQPRAVFSDLAFLDTLPPRQWTNGFAEILKYGVIADPELLAILGERADALRQGDEALLTEVVHRSSRIKKEIVEDDEREGGRRRILNFGHTVGHAIEAESGFSILHGEAVAIGMVCAALLSQRLGHLSAGDRDAISEVIRGVGLPVRIPTNLSLTGILARLARDKKKAGSRLHFVLVKGIGCPFIDGDVPPQLVREVIADVMA